MGDKNGDNKRKERKKINNIDEIWDGKKLIIKDFSNLDLEGLDLSVIPKEEWYDCIIENTSFKNTGVKIFSSCIACANNYIIKDCDFSYNDLSDSYNVENIFFDSCDFRETNLEKDIYGKNNYLDKNFTKWKRAVGFNLPPIDIDTLRKNPQVIISSRDLLFIIRLNILKVNIEECINLIEEFLKYDKEGHLKKLYDTLKNELMEYEIINLFAERRVLNVKFNDINLDIIDKDVLSFIKFTNCEFNNLTLRHDIKNLLYISSEALNNSNEFNNIILPSITYSSWQDKPSYSRISQTPATFRTNLYLELGRLCNAKCEFCRNSYYCDNTYDFDKIEKALRKVIPKLDSIVIGGGEPSLKLEDLKKIIFNSYESLRRNNVGIYLFTNGTHKYIDEELGAYNFKYNISRHAINDEENASIFKLPSKKIMSSEELKWFMYQNPKTTLAATCFKGGLDSKQKIIDYIKYAGSMGCESILFSDLIVMEDELLKTKENYNFNIESKVFEDVILYLENKGYKKSIPIYATGGYVLTMLKKGDINISFKHYISKKVLEENWPIAIKRTFDLSIDPNGNLYENWHQTSEAVNIKKLKLK